jgi:hypothetical protein
MISLSHFTQMSRWYLKLSHGGFLLHPLKGKATPVTGRGGPYGCETSRLPHFLDIWLTDEGEVIFTRWPPLSPGICLVLINVRGCVDPGVIVWLKGLGQLKNPVTSGIEPATSTPHYTLISLPFDASLSAVI